MTSLMVFRSDAKEKILRLRMRRDASLKNTDFVQNIE